MKFNPETGVYDLPDYPDDYITTKQDSASEIPAKKIPLPKTTALSQSTNAETQKAMLKKAKWIPYVLIGVIVLSVYPQLKPFTLIPLGPNSAARHLVRPIRPAFETA